MASETDTAEYLVPARHEKDVDERNRPRNINTASHEKEHTSYEIELQKEGTKSDEQRKQNLEVREGNNKCTDGECIPSVGTSDHEDIVREPAECAEGISDDTKLTISKGNYQQQVNEKIPTAEEAEVQPIESLGPDDPGKETSDSVISVKQEVKCRLYDEKDVPCLGKDNKRNTDVDAHVEQMINFSSLKNEMLEIPVCAFDRLEDYGDERMTCSEVDDVTLSQKYTSPINGNKKSMSVTMKDNQELCISPQEGTDTTKEHKGLHEAGTDRNLEKASKSLSEKDVEDKNILEGRNCNTADLLQDFTTAAKFKGITDFRENIISPKDDNLCLGYKTKAKEETNRKHDVDMDLQPEEEEKHTTEDSSEEKFYDKQAFEGSKNTYLTSSTTTSNEVTERKGVGHAISITEEEEVPKFLDSEAEERQEIQIQEELTEAETKQMIFDSDLRESNTARTNKISNLTESMGKDIMKGEHLSEVSIDNGTAEKSSKMKQDILRKNEADDTTAMRSTSANLSFEDMDLNEREETAMEVDIYNREAKNAVSKEDIASTEEDITAKSDSTEALQDEKTQEQIGFDDKTETKVVHNEIIMNQSSEKSDACWAIQEQDSAKACTETPLIEVETPIPSINECTSISSEDIQDSKAKEEEMEKQNEDPDTTKKGLSAHKDRIEEILPENENITNTCKTGKIQEINAQFGSIETQEEAKINEQTCSDDIYDSNVIKKEIVNQSSEESDSCSSCNRDQENAQASTPHKEVVKLVPSKDIHIGSSITDFQESEIEKEASIEEQHCAAEVPDMTTNDVSLNKGIKAQSHTIEESKYSTTKEEICFIETETQMVNNEKIANQCSEDSDFGFANRDQEASQIATIPLVEASSHAYEDDCLKKSGGENHESRVVEESSIEKECISEMEPKNIITGVCSDEVRAVESVLINEISINLVEAVDQDKNRDSHSMEVQKDENACKILVCSQMYETVNQNSKVSNCGEESIPLIEADTLIPDKEAHTKVSNEILEIKEEAKIEKQQYSVEEHNKITNGFSSNEVQGVEIEQVDNFVHIIGGNQEINVEIERNEIQTDHNEFYEIQVVNKDVNEGQTTEESNPYTVTQDQKNEAATTQHIEAQGFLPSIHENTTGISKAEIEVSEVEKEPVTQDLSGRKYAAFSYSIGEVEIVRATENSNNIEEDMDQDVNQLDTIELQKKGKTLEQKESNEIYETQEVHNEEIVNQWSEDSDFPCGKQDETMAEEYTSLIGAQQLVPSKDRCTLISSNKIVPQDVDEAENASQDINVQSDSIEVRKDDKTHCNRIHEIENINQERLGNQSSEESNSCIDKKDQEIARESIPIIEAENLVQRTDECTSTPCEDVQISEVEEEAMIGKQQYSTEMEDLDKNTNDVSPYKNFELAAMKEILTTELREANNAGNDAIERNIQHHSASSTIEKAIDADQINKETPGTEKECNDCNQDNFQQAIARDKPNDEVNTMHPVQPEDQRNVYDKQFMEKAEAPELSKSREIEESLSVAKKEDTKEEIQVDNYSYRIPNPQTAVGTGASVDNASIEMGILDQGQPDKISNVHTQTENEADIHKPEIEGPEDMNDSFEEEVKRTNKSNEVEISSVPNDADTVCAMVEQEEIGALNEGKITSVQYALAPKVRFLENNNEDKQELDFGENKHNFKILTPAKEDVCSLGSNDEEVLEVFLTNKPGHAGSSKVFPQNVEDLSILAAKEVRQIQLTEPNQISKDIFFTELYAKDLVEDQEFDNNKKEADVPEASVPFTICQDVNEKTADTIMSTREEAWRVNKPKEKLQVLSSEHLGQKHGVVKSEDEDESYNIIEVSREEKTHECLAAQKVYLSEEDKRVIGGSYTDFIPNQDLQLKEDEDVTTENSTRMGFRDMSSDFEAAKSPSTGEKSTESNTYKGSFSQETRNEDECQHIEKSEETNNISSQHYSSSELISENNIVQTRHIISDIQRQSESFEEIAKTYVQEGVHSEDIEKDYDHRRNTREVIVEKFQSKENFGDHIVAISNPKSTEVTEETNISEEPKNFERESTMKRRQEASSEKMIEYEVNSMDTMDDASQQTIDKKATRQDNLQDQKHENQLDLTDSDKIDRSNLQDSLLRGDMAEVVDISTIQQDSYKSVEIPNVPSSVVSTKCHDQTASSQQVSEPHGAVLTKTNETHHQLISSEPIAEEIRLPDFGAHEAKRNEDKHDKSIVLPYDSTLTQQSVKKTESLDKEEKAKMGEEQEKNTELTNPSVDGEADVSDTGKGLNEYPDYEAFHQAKDAKEDDNIHTESIETGKRQACTQKGVSAIESKRNGATWLPLKDPNNPISDVKDESREQVLQGRAYDEAIETRADSNIKRESTAQQEQVIVHKSKTDDEDKQGKQQDSNQVPLMSDMELKATHKRSHNNILSGVGSKVKHSISKVKKAMACTTSHFASEEVIIKLNKNKNPDKA